MSNSNIVWLSRDIKYSNLSEKISSDLKLDVMHFDNENKCYNFLIGNKSEILFIENSDELDVHDVVLFIRSIFKRIYIIVLDYDKQLSKCDLLEKGADYIINPLDGPEIVKSIAKRCIERSAKLSIDTNKNYSYAGWSLHTLASTITCPDGKTLKLTLTERDFLKIFFEHMGEECTFELIAGRLGIDPSEPYRHRIEVIIFRLRRKFKNSLFIDLPIRSMRGIGYIFDIKTPDNKYKYDMLQA